MLKCLKIQNFALIDKLEIEFEPFFNVITGETGSGKSIMIDSLGFVFGDRADKSNIREGKNQVSVSAEFDKINPAVISQIENTLGIELNNESIVLERSFDVSGKSQSKINGVPANMAVLSEISHKLIDIHGQHEHQAIMSNDFQLDILDLFCRGEAKQKLAEIGAVIDEINDIDRDLKNLGGSLDEKQNLIDLYSYQVNEIEHADIKENEFEELTQKKTEMLSFEKIVNALKEYYQTACDNPFGDSASDLIFSATKNIGNIQNISENYAKLHERLQSVIAEFDDINAEINKILKNFNFDQNEFDRIDQRLDLIKSLFKKYGGDYENFCNYFEKTKNKLSLLIGGEQKHLELCAKKEKLLEKIKKIQNELTEIRKKYAIEMSSQITAQLGNLGMKNAKLEIEFSLIDLPYSRKGQDQIEFLFSANLGFALRPLRKVISGGEMSRFMLAYKIVVGELDNISTMIFDEIDTGISGQMAQVVAECMAKLSRQKQIIAITHLPQICAMADKNMRVAKFSDGTSTYTKLDVMDMQQTYQEISRLMGANDSEQAIALAKEIKDKSNIFKTEI